MVIGGWARQNGCLGISRLNTFVSPPHWLSGTAVATHEGATKRLWVTSTYFEVMSRSMYTRCKKIDRGGWRDHLVGG